MSTGSWRGRSAFLVASYVLGYVLVTWPWALRLWTAVPSGGDQGMFVWGFWWMRRSIETMSWPFTSTAVMAPYGASFALHTWMPLPAVTSIPLQWIFGVTTAYNLVVAAIAVLAGLCAYLLARDLGLRPGPAWVAGLAFAFTPSLTDRYALLGHVNLSLVFWLPLGLLLLRRWLRRPSTGRAAVLGAAAAGTLLSDVTITVFAAGLVLTYLLGWVALRRGGVGLAHLRTVPAGAAAAVLLALPLIVAVATAIAAGLIDAPTGLLGSPEYSIDLAGVVVSDARHPVLGPLQAGWRAQLGARLEGPGSFGAVIGLLALTGAMAYRRLPVVRWMVALSFLALVLAMGPTIVLLGERYVPLPVTLGDDPTPVSALMPHTWLQAIPVLNGLRAPQRFLLVMAVPLAILAGLGCQWLLERRSWIGRAVVVLAVPLLLAEAMSPVVAHVPAAPPPVYAAIAADPDTKGIVVDVPLGFRTGIVAIGHQTGPPLLYATTHGKPVAVGFVSRLSRQRLEDVASIPLYRDLMALQDQDPASPPPQTTPARGARSAARENLRHVVVRRDVQGLPLVTQYLEDACFALQEEDPVALRFLYVGCPSPG